MMMMDNNMNTEEYVNKLLGYVDDHLYGEEIDATIVNMHNNNNNNKVNNNNINVNSSLGSDETLNLQSTRYYRNRSNKSPIDTIVEECESWSNVFPYFRVRGETIKVIENYKQHMNNNNNNNNTRVDDNDNDYNDDDDDDDYNSNNEDDEEILAIHRNRIKKRSSVTSNNSEGIKSGDREDILISLLCEMLWHDVIVPELSPLINMKRYVRHSSQPDITNLSITGRGVKSRYGHQQSHQLLPTLQRPLTSVSTMLSGQSNTMSVPGHHHRKQNLKDAMVIKKYQQRQRQMRDVLPELRPETRRLRKQKIRNNMYRQYKL